MQELSKSNAKNHGAQDVTEVTPPNSASHSTSGSDKKPKRHWLQLFTLWKNPDDAADALMVDADPKYAQQIRFWATFILWTSIVFVVIAFFWAKYSKLDETTRGEGRVIPASQVQVIQNLEGGIVKKILVREGEIVHSAQPLLQIDDVLAEARYQEAQNKILSLEARSLRLKAITQNQPLIIPTSLQEKVPDLVGYQQDLYDAQQKELGQMRTTYSIIHKEYQFTKPLVAKGAAAPVEVLRLERQMSQMQQDLNSFQSRALQELNETEANIAITQASIVELRDRLTRTIVRSPVKGIVKQIKIKTLGGVSQPGMDLMEIVPLEDSLLFEVKINPKDVGFLHISQKALIKISAYDFSIYGGLPGKVEEISPDAIVNNNPASRGESYYLVRVRTDKNFLKGKDGKPLYIIPGMSGTADILTGEKSILTYLLKPIIKAKENAMTER